MLLERGERKIGFGILLSETDESATWVWKRGVPGTSVWKWKRFWRGGGDDSMGRASDTRVAEGRLLVQDAPSWWGSIYTGVETHPLWKAVEDGDVDTVRAWMDMGVDVDVRYRGWTLLMKAADLGDAEMLRVLLEYRASVSVVNHKRRTPLSFAVRPSFNGARLRRGGSVKQVLLDHGAYRETDEWATWTWKQVYCTMNFWRWERLWTCGESGGERVMDPGLAWRTRMLAAEERPPLWRAVEVGDTVKVLELLMDASNWASARRAAEAGDTARVLELLRDFPGRVDVDVRHRGWTPLMKAAELGNVDMLRYLLECRADVGAENRKKRTPLSLAVRPSFEGWADFGRPIYRRPNPAAIKVLLHHGADMDGQRDYLGVTVLEYVKGLLPDGVLDSRPIPDPEREAIIEVWEDFVHGFVVD